jgi:hypothetical protein
MEAEESMALEAVTKQRHVKTQKNERLSACCSELHSVRISDNTIINSS